MTWKKEIRKAPLEDFKRRKARFENKDLMPYATPPASKITLDEALAELKEYNDPSFKEHMEVLQELIEFFDEVHELDTEPKDSEGYPY